MNPLTNFFPLDDLSEENKKVSSWVERAEVIRDYRRRVAITFPEPAPRDPKIVAFEKGNHLGPMGALEKAFYQNNPGKTPLVVPLSHSVDYNKPFAIWVPSNIEGFPPFADWMLVYQSSPTFSSLAIAVVNYRTAGTWKNSKWLLAAPYTKPGDRYKPDAYNQPDADGWFLHDPEKWGKAGSPVPEFVKKAALRLGSGFMDTFDRRDALHWGTAPHESSRIIAWKPLSFA